jgi:predicted nucleic acid-binding protein
MYLFIDTNIFLSFYHYTSDDLEELRKLIVLLDQRKVGLILPEQVVTEFVRNRESKISDALKRLKDQKLNLQFPQLCKDYPMYARLRELQREYDKVQSELLDALSHDIGRETLKADDITRELFGLATHIPTRPRLIEAARLRCDLGNPPGKSGSLGDAINWESILEGSPVGEDIFFVTDDKDYCSPLDERHFNLFLSREWHRINKSHLLFYSKLSALFGELRALAFQKQSQPGTPAMAIDSLAQALDLAEPEGYCLLFTEAGRGIIPLQQGVMKDPARPDRVKKYARRLLAIVSRDEKSAASPSEGSKPADELIEPLTDRELAVLRLIADGLKYEEIAGRLYISLNTVRT